MTILEMAVLEPFTDLNRCTEHGFDKLQMRLSWFLKYSDICRDVMIKFVIFTLRAGRPTGG